MERKKFELVALGVISLSLVYVPTKYCSGARCVAGDWDFIFNLDGAQTVDFTRLIIQIAVIGIALFGYWRYKYHA